MTPRAHVAKVTREVSTALEEWVRSLLEEADLSLPVRVDLPETGESLVLLPYQLVLESQAGVPLVPLMPTSGEARREAIPAPWREIARGMTQILVEQFPQRSRNQPGLGPLDPCPPLAEIPAPLQDWYRAHPDWQVENGRGRLPQISWRQPFSLVIRYTALVSGCPSLRRLQALSVVAAGIRQDRYFQAMVPATPQDAPLGSLVDAFALSAPEPLRADLEAAADASRADHPLAVGVFAHHDLTDNDLALVMQALQLPMQPAVVFGARLSLGAGATLLPGAVPHLGSVSGIGR